MATWQNKENLPYSIPWKVAGLCLNGQLFHSDSVVPTLPCAARFTRSAGKTPADCIDAAGPEVAMLFSYSLSACSPWLSNQDQL